MPPSMIPLLLKSLRQITMYLFKIVYCNIISKILPIRENSYKMNGGINVLIMIFSPFSSQRNSLWILVESSKTPCISNAEMSWSNNNLVLLLDKYKINVRIIILLQFPIYQPTYCTRQKLNIELWSKWATNQILIPIQFRFSECIFSNGCIFLLIIVLLFTVCIQVEGKFIQPWLLSPLETVLLNDSLCWNVLNLTYYSYKFATTKTHTKLKNQIPSFVPYFLLQQY